VRKQFLEAEQKMTDADFDILKVKALKNELETYCYDMRSKVDAYGNLEKYIDPSVKDGFIKEINEVVDWLYDAGENATYEEYKKRLDHFRTIGEPVKEREFYYGELPTLISEFQKATQHIQDRLASPELAHLTEEQRDNVLKKHQACQEYFQKVEADKAAKQLHQDAAYKLNDITAMLSQMKTETNAILSTPPPKPEPKSEEKA